MAISNRHGSNWRSFTWHHVLVSLILSVVLLVTGCDLGPPPPSQFDQAQRESTQRNAPPAVAKTATQGSSFNKFFPAAEDGFQRVYTQEKKGFAEAKLKQNGKDLAMLSISDTSSVPDAAKKYEKSSSQIGGYPALEIGNTQTGVLVADRYQVKVLSRDPAFTKTDRQAWLAKFDLNGLAKLK